MDQTTPLPHPMDKLHGSVEYLAKKVRFHSKQTADSFAMIRDGLSELDQFRALFGNVKSWNAEGVKLLRETSKE